RRRLYLDELAWLAGRALAGSSGAVQTHLVLVDDGFPPLVGLPLHRALHEHLGLVIELVPGGETDDGERDGEADRQREHVARHLVPTGLEGGHGASDAAIDSAALQRGHDIAEGNRHARGTERLDQIALRCALHPDLLAFEIRQTLERRV